MKLKKITAVAAAALLTAQVAGVSVFANGSDSYVDGYNWYNPSTDKYYPTRTEAVDAGGNTIVLCNGDIMDPATTVVKPYDLSGSGSGSSSTSYAGYPNPTAAHPYYNSETGLYYTTQAAAYAADPTGTVVNTASGHTTIYSDGYLSPAPSHAYYNPVTQLYYPTYTDAYNAYPTTGIYDWYDGSYSTTTSYGTGYSSWSSTTRYYNTYTHLFYTTASAAANASALGSVLEYTSNPGYVNSHSSSTGYYYNGVYFGDSSSTRSGYYQYYSNATGRWYPSQAAANAATNYYNYYGYNYGYYYGDSSPNQSKDYPYYSAATRRYYRTQAAANAAGAGSYSNSPYSLYYTAGYPWYSSYTKKYYPTQAAALQASYGNSAYVSYSAAASGYTYYDWYYGNYYGYDPNLPNYQAFKNRVGSGTTIAKGTPYITASKSYNGWDTLVSLAKKAKTGQGLDITLNGSSIIPESILSAVKGKNIGLRFKLDNGSYWTINGTNITEPRSLNLSVEYNINVIPSKLKKNAKKDGLGAYQIGITNGNDALGTMATVTVKLNASRAGTTAYIYRYDSDTKTLKGIYKNVVTTDGWVSFNVTDGGAYYVVVK